MSEHLIEEQEEENWGVNHARALVFGALFALPFWGLIGLAVFGAVKFLGGAS